MRKKKKPEIKIGVRDLLETYFTPKDLELSFYPTTRAQEGAAGHRLLIARRPRGYKREVPIEFTYETDAFRLIVRGRVDGLLVTKNKVLVEEIKTTYSPVDRIDPGHYPVHEAQLKLYTYFYMAKSDAIPVMGRLTYLNLDDLSEKSFDYQFSLIEGEDFFRALAESYLAAASRRQSWRQIRDRSLSELAFPFAEPRAGQVELMNMVNEALEQERDLFAEAATGTGKTIAILYPALKKLAVDDRINRIFFLTAKNAGKEILKKTLVSLMDRGLRLRTVFIEAKERVCLAPDIRCHPKDCPYAVDYYAKAGQALPDLLEQEYLTLEAIRETAAAHRICPFELSLDLALHADLIVCDYNYLFDPGVALRRFFTDSNRKDSLFLIDEAHNLVARGREMFSASLSQSGLRRFGEELEKCNPKIMAVCQKLDLFFQNWQKELAAEHTPGMLLSRLPEFFLPSLETLAALLEFQLRENGSSRLRDKLQDFYFELVAFIRIAGLANDDYPGDYALYVKPEKEGSASLTLRIFCLNPGPLLRERLDYGRAAVFFSATLTPFDYFRELLGGKPDALTVRITSPFPRETRLYLHVPGIDTRYRLRSKTAQTLAQCIASLAVSHTGNYLVFFPSYAYLQQVLPLVTALLKNRALLHVQYPSMKEQERLEFLRKITATGGNKSNVGLAVLGGSFGEGIDLPGEQLIGVMVIGPGLPMVCEEQELIRRYFEERDGRGFFFAYLIPGLIRVIQAAGRVFRTPEDKGVVILVDDRFLQEQYQELLPPDWFVPGRAFSQEDYERALREFWDQN